MNLLNAAKNLQDEVRASHSGLGGELRITTTPEFGEQVIIPLLAQFSQRHPDLRIRHMSSSHHADLIAERFDVAIRQLAGRLPLSRRADIPLYHSAGRRAAVARPQPRVVAGVVGSGGMDYS